MATVTEILEMVEDTRSKMNGWSSDPDFLDLEGMKKYVADFAASRGYNTIHDVGDHEQIAALVTLVVRSHGESAILPAARTELRIWLEGMDY